MTALALVPDPDETKQTTWQDSDGNGFTHAELGGFCAAVAGAAPPSFADRLKTLDLYHAPLAPSLPPDLNGPGRDAAYKARFETFRLRYLFEHAVSTVIDSAEAYKEALQGKLWRKAGYESVTAWRTVILSGLDFSKGQRKIIIDVLLAAGFTVTEVQEATGAGRGTIAREREGLSVPDGTELAPKQQAALGNRNAAGVRDRNGSRAAPERTESEPEPDPRPQAAPEPQGAAQGEWEDAPPPDPFWLYEQMWQYMTDLAKVVSEYPAEVPPERVAELDEQLADAAGVLAGIRADLSGTGLPGGCQRATGRDSRQCGPD